MPRDSSFDILHYHLHNGWSALNGRWRIDLAPADMHSFLNPAHSALIWWLIERLPGRLVVAVLSPIQAALLPVCYALAARLAARACVQLPRYVLFLAAVIGFAALPNQIMLASIQNDHWGALAFLLALAVVMSPRSMRQNLWSLAGVSFLLGAMTGMKPTNFVYVIGFATAVILSAETWRIRLQSVSVAAIAGIMGIVLVGGYWAFMLWDLYGNPLFPYLSDVFSGSELNPEHSFRDDRFVPVSLIDLLIRPIAFSLNGGLIYEFADADPRFLLLYLCTIGFVASSCAGAFRTGASPAGGRHLMAMCLTMLVTYVTWASLFSIVRYALALWVMAPIVSVVLIGAMLTRLSRTNLASSIALIICVALLAATSPLDRRRIAWTSWTEPYVWMERPQQFDIRNSVIVFSTKYPSAFLAPAFSEAAWLTHADTPEWSEAALENYRHRRDIALENTEMPVFLAMYVRQGSASVDLARMASGINLRADFEKCHRLRTAFDIKTERGESYWTLCPTERASSNDAAVK